MRVSVGDIMKEKAESTKSGSFGSMWNPGDTGVVFYPFWKNPLTGGFELLLAAQRGHQVPDMKELGINTSFIPTLSEFDDDGNVIGTGDIAYQFSRVAPCFTAGQKEVEMANVRSRTGIDETTRQTLYQQIEAKYDRTKMKSVKPVIGGLTYYIATECVYVPMKNEQPGVQEARIVSQKMSDARIKKLMALAADSKFEPVPLEGTDIYYLEVQYSWPTGDKAEAGKVDPQGLTPEWRLESKHPNEFKALMPELSKLPTEMETIAKRNFAFVKLSENRIKQALTNYAIMKTEYLDALNTTVHEDMIKRIEKSASLFNELRITDNLHNEDLIEKISTALELQHAQDNTVGNSEPKDTTSEEAPVLSSAPSVEELLMGEHIGSEDDLSTIDDGE